MASSSGLMGDAIRAFGRMESRMGKESTRTRRTSRERVSGLEGRR